MPPDPHAYQAPVVTSLLVLLAMLTGCGGGSGQTDAALKTPVSPTANLEWTPPAANQGRPATSTPPKQPPSGPTAVAAPPANAPVASPSEPDAPAMPNPPLAPDGPLLADTPNASAAPAPRDPPPARGDSASEPTATVLPRLATVVLTSPTEDDNVHTVNTSVPVQVSVSTDGGASPNGVAVTLDAPGASVAPVRQLTRGGIAAYSLQATQAGELRLRASVTTTQTEVSASRTLHVRPQPQALGLLVPAYFSARPDSQWDALSASALAFSAVPITVILNPNNGIFTKEDPAVTSAIHSFRQNGGKILAYVYTRYGRGSRSIADIKRNIDNYRSIYGADIDGFFLDEMDASSARLDFYREVHGYIKSLDSRLRVVGNPGTYPIGDYAAVADALVTFEGQAREYRTIDPQPENLWVYKHPNNKQAALVHDAEDCGAMQEAVLAAHGARRNTGLVYATDRHYDYASDSGDPWASLPGYWNQLLATVEAINQGRALPACQAPGTASR